MSPLWRLRARIRAIDPRTADVILAGLFAVAAVIESVLSHSVAGHVGLAAVVGALAVGPSLALRRSKPIAAAAIFIGVLLGSDLLGPSVGDELATPFIAALVLFYSLGRYSEGAASGPASA